MIFMSFEAYKYDLQFGIPGILFLTFRVKNIVRVVRYTAYTIILRGNRIPNVQFRNTTISLFVQLGFSSNVQLQVTSDGLYFDSLVAKHLSDLYYDSSFNF